MKSTPAFLCALTVFFAFGRSAAAFPSASSDHQLTLRGRRPCSPRHSGSLTRDTKSIENVCFRGFFSSQRAAPESLDGTSADESHGVVGISRGGGAGGGHLSLDKGLEFVSKNFFLLGKFSALIWCLDQVQVYGPVHSHLSFPSISTGMVTAVSMARIAPSLGKNGSILRPEVFFGQYGVAAIFALSGLSLAFGELQNAFENIKL